ncbi:MAG: hypothetical protein ACFFCS_18530 [Candidatus Hodarchaeota archaeon]
MHSFFEKWSSIFAYDNDIELLKDKGLFGEYFTVDEFIHSKDFGNTDSKLLHEGLLPIPYCGNIFSAKLIILTLNPRLQLGDYFAEKDERFLNALRENLNQEREDFPFLFLDPSLSFHPGYNWWTRKLGYVLNKFFKFNVEKKYEIQNEISKKIANIELIPFHSFGFEEKIMKFINELEYPKDLRLFLEQEILPKVEAGSCKLVVNVGPAKWKEFMGDNLTWKRLTKNGRITIDYKQNENIRADDAGFNIII